MSVDLSATVGDLATEDPRRSRILEKFGIDYCCNGQRPLAEAARDAGVDPDDLAKELDIPARTRPEGRNSLENAALAHDIVDTHHAYMWQEMPQLQALIDKVHRAHGARHPELSRVQAAFAEAVEALDPHLTAEERVIFPEISRLEKTQTPSTPGLATPIEQLRAEHALVGELFKELHELTDGYSAPPDACNSYRAMLTRLKDMELDLHEHIHKENNILFPRVLRFEQQHAQAGPS